MAKEKQKLSKVTLKEFIFHQYVTWKHAKKCFPIGQANIFSCGAKKLGVVLKRSGIANYLVAVLKGSTKVN